MTQKIPLLTLAITAAGALLPERAVSRAGSYATAAGKLFGITNTDGAAGDRVPTDVMGTTIATAGGAFSDGAELEVGSSGKLVVKASGTVVAVALQDANADGDRVEVLLK